MKLLLGSKSPRRRELLHNLGLKFQMVSIECEEDYPGNLPIEEIAAYLAEKKSSVYKNLAADEVLLTSDTIVVLDKKVLGKPNDEEHSREMLRQLSGKIHEVHTAVTLRSSDRYVTKTDIATVHVNELIEEEISYYITNCKPFDKAGSYGVQDWLGLAKINRIEGSFYTIMGLPTHLIYEMLKEFKS